MRNLVLFICFWALSQAIVFAQTPVSLTSSTYTQNFDGIGATGTTFPDGWNAVRYAGTGTSAVSLLVNDGSATSGGIYNVGTPSATDRAMGTLASGSTSPAFGAAFTNNSTAAITSLAFSAFHEQWKTGSSNTVNETVVFEYSLDATSLTSGTWIAFPAMDLNEILTTSTAANAVDGNAAANRVAISGTINSLNIPIGATFWIRWRDSDAPGSDGMYALDDFQMVYASAASDITPPTITTLSPANNATNVVVNPNATITFSEPVQKGTGAITVKKASDNSVVQTIAVTDPAVVVSGNQAFFNLTLSNNTSYYITIDAGAFKDLANNNFAGILNATTWSFTTVAPPAAGVLGTTYTFNNCGNYVNEGFKTFSVSGAQVWTCTKFGRTYVSDPSSDSAIQMNGFASGNQTNEDWLISPKFDLSGTTVPLLNFYSRSAFAGPELTLKVSTNYSGSGDPTAATWTTLNGEFPATASDVWSLSDSINLSAYKTNNVYVAWVYTSTTVGASRWTLDDVKFYNSTVTPLPLLAVNEKMLDFREALFGSSSPSKSFTFSAANLTTNLAVTAPAGFELSKDGITYSGSLTYNPLEATNPTVFVRFKPTAANASFSGKIQFTSAGINNSQVLVKGNSYPFATTLNLANWNIEWFGSTASGQGPADDDLAQANAKKVMDYLNADAYGVAEIVDVTRFGNLVTSLNGGYSYVVADYCSSGSTAGACSNSQKLAFIYKTSLFSNVTARPLLKGSTTASSNWASGRFPFLVNANVTKNGQTANINFIVVHAKANTGTPAEQIDAYNRRKAGVQELKDTLDAFYANANLIIFGDYNDDLDRTIAPTTGADTVSSYSPLISDSTDANHYKALTLLLSYAGLASTANNPEVIDHVVISNELESSYIPNSVSLYNDIGAVANITNYSTTTSDHFPVLSRFNIPSAVDNTPPTLVSTQPANNAINVGVNPTLTATFSETIAAGTGNLLVKKVSDNSVVATTAISAATINGAVLSWSVTGLQSTTAYYVEIPATAVKDAAGNFFAGIAGAASWKFTTADIAPPTLVSTDPVNNATGVALAPNLKITFSEPVVAGTGNILVKNASDNSIAATIPVTSTTVSGAVVSFTASGLSSLTAYYVEVPATAFKDLSNNAFAGFTGATTWKFTTLDNVPPTLVSTNPTANQVGVSLNPSLIFTFSETIMAGAGNVLIKKVSDNSTVVTLSAASAVISGSQATFAVTGLQASTQYYVEVQNTAFKDLAANPFAGFIGSATLSFTTTTATAIPFVSPAAVQLIIYPNPVGNRLKFSFVPKAGSVMYSLIDAKGATVVQTTSKTVIANKITEVINISQLAAGNYWLKIINNKQLIVQKLSKQ